jgi:Anti-sigma regulatory factor (Ser/Thr protein kinase)
MQFHYEVPGDDFSLAGHASTEMKKILVRLGMPNDVVKRVAVAMYEAEINMVVHAGGGDADITVDPDSITIIMKDEGPGIPDIPLAMQDGYSTASEEVRALGFGAGMGLSNMKRNTDEMAIDSTVGKGTTVTMKILIPERA